MPSYGHPPLIYACLTVLKKWNMSFGILSVLECEGYRLDLPLDFRTSKDLASATLPFPPLVARMALRTLSTSSAVSFLAFFWRGSFSILCIKARLAAFSRSAGASVGSNYKRRSVPPCTKMSNS